MNIERIGERHNPVCSPEVGWAQQQLNRVAGEQLRVDGIEGPRTRAAVERFQQRAGLSATGTLNTETLRALQDFVAEESDNYAANTNVSSDVNSEGIRMPEIGAESAYARYERANNLVESNHQEVYSRLRTVGGAPASFGAGQLLLPDHLSQLQSLQRRNPDLLPRLGISSDDIEHVERATDRALHAFDAIVSNRIQDESRDVRAAVQTFRAAEQPVSDPELISRLTEAFEISPSQLEQLGMALDLRALREQFVGAPGNRDTAFERIASDPRATNLRDALGETSFRHYITRGALAENRGGFAMAAARAEVGEHRLDGLLRAMSPLTTESRTRSNFARAEHALRNVDNVSVAEREVLLAQVAREFHAAPGAATRVLFAEGQPRFADADDIRNEIRSLSTARHHGDSRAFDRFERAVRTAS